MATDAKTLFCLADITAAYLDVTGASDEEVRRVFLRDAAANLHRAGPVFTHDMIRALRELAPGPSQTYESMELAEQAIANLEALLPPEE